LNIDTLFLIAGAGRYPALVAEEAKRSGVGRIVAAAFEGETDHATVELCDAVNWLRVGQLGKLLEAARASGAACAVMAGQLAPKNLFNLRPDLKALVLLAKLPRRNAETLFGEASRQLAGVGVEVLPATTFLDGHLASEGHMAGPRPKARVLADLHYAFGLAKETSRLDIGQSVVVRNGTVLAVEAFEGTDACMRRGAGLGQGHGILAKVSKPGQDMRFDVPVIGLRTLETAKSCGINAMALEAGKTLLLDRPAVCAAADTAGITLFGFSS
jgi:UDP-2,3-diacylglucosamine hydrolase